jgi:hypothetical protein
MALKISKEKASFRCAVTIYEPVDNGHSESKVQVRFKVIAQSRIDAVINNDLDEDEDILQEVLVGWDENAFQDESGAPLLYNDENKKLVLDVPYVRTSLMKEYFKSLNGKDYKRKN